MKRAIALVMTLLVWAGAVATAQAAAPVTSVPSVDLGRYAGTWYEAASFPMFFERHCAGDTTAQYRGAGDGSIAVTNRCQTKTGMEEAVGRATVVAGTGDAQLKVSFFWPFRADYWVIGLDSDYRWAVVGNPNRKYLWILSRTPQLSPELLEAALSSARAQGFDTARLRYTPQGESAH